MGFEKGWGPARRAYAITRRMYAGGRPGRVARWMNRFSAAWYATGLLVPHRCVTMEVVGRRSGRVVADVRQDFLPRGFSRSGDEAWAGPASRMGRHSHAGAAADESGMA